MVENADSRWPQAADREVLIVLCTCPDTAQAERLATGLVENKFAACVNILPEIRSIYRWEGKVHQDGEVLALVKTTRQAYEGLQQWLLRHHPYEVPEILALPVVEGSENYLEWVINEPAAI
jgi:periplasmic divalent cation tolerance protein